MKRLLLAFVLLGCLLYAVRPTETWYVAIDGHWTGYLYDIRFANGDVKEVHLPHAPFMDRGTAWAITVRKDWLAFGGPYYDYQVVTARQLTPSDSNRHLMIWLTRPMFETTGCQ